MVESSVTRRDFLKIAAVASAGIELARAGHPTPHSTELRGLQERLLEARAKRERLHHIVRDAEGRRPPFPESIKDPHSRTHLIYSNNQLRLGQPASAGTVGASETDVRVANHLSDFDRQTIALEAAESAVGNIEKAMVDFEPRSIADLRLQIVLALHQEVIDYGMDESLPRLICERFLRLIPAQSVTRVDRTNIPAKRI